MKNSRGKSRRYSYNARGALTEYVGADGRHFLFQYDMRGTLQNVIKAQNANFTYRRDQTENVFGIKKAKPNNIWQFQKINYQTPLAGASSDLSSSSSTQDACLFGRDDGFLFTDPSETWLRYDIIINDPWNSCNDPFGGMVDLEFSGFGGEAETCERCRIRNEGICMSGVGRDIGYGTWVAVALIGCMAAGPGAVACVIIGALFIAAGTAIYAYNNYNICINQIIDKCPQCN